MIQFASVAASPPEMIQVAHVPDNVGQILQQHVRAMASEGFSEIDVRWSSTALCVEARRDDVIVRLECDPTGRSKSERVYGQGIAIKRTFNADGTAVISEEIFDFFDDR